MAAGLTKEQLKNELISHGVQPPLQSARKEEFVKLYEQHVAPIASQKGDFSSDEETEAPGSESVVTNNTSLNCNGLDIASLSDEELYAHLQSYGIPVGPIVETTRLVYQRKLAAVMRNGGTTPQTEVESNQNNSNGHHQQEDKFSDSEEEQEAEPATVRQPESSPVKPETKSTNSSASSTTKVVDAPEVQPTAVPTMTEPLTSIRKRVNATERPPSALSAQPLVDRQGTPTPRPSIRTIQSSSSSYKFESRRLLDTTDGSTVQQLPARGGSGSSTNSRTIVRFILLLVIAMAVAYITYTYVDINQLKKWVDNIQSKVFQSLKTSEKVDQPQPTPVKEV